MFFCIRELFLFLRFKRCFTNGTVLYIMDEIVKFSCSNRVLFLLTFPACRNECVNAALISPSLSLLEKYCFSISNELLFKKTLLMCLAAEFIIQRNNSYVFSFI